MGDVHVTGLHMLVLQSRNGYHENPSPCIFCVASLSHYAQYEVPSCTQSWGIFAFIQKECRNKVYMSGYSRYGTYRSNSVESNAARSHLGVCVVMAASFFWTRWYETKCMGTWQAMLIVGQLQETKSNWMGGVDTFSSCFERSNQRTARAECWFRPPLHQCIPTWGDLTHTGCTSACIPQTSWCKHSQVNAIVKSTGSWGALELNLTLTLIWPKAWL